jgi:hypothetical protein
MIIDNELLLKIANNDPAITAITLTGKYDNYTYDNNDSLSQQQFQKLETALKNNTRVISLELSNLMIHKGVKEFAEIFKTNQSIKKVSLRVTNLWGDNIKILVDALQHNSTVCYLDITGNFIDDKEAQWLVNLLQSNRSIVDLKVDANSQVPDGWGGSNSINISQSILDTLATLLKRNIDIKNRNNFLSQSNPALITTKQAATEKYGPIPGGPNPNI